jgi:hypothetical protein
MRCKSEEINLFPTIRPASQALWIVAQYTVYKYLGRARQASVGAATG